MIRIRPGLVALSFALPFALVGASGCSGADFQVVDDGGGADATADSTASDTAVDTGARDTGAGPDTGPAKDTGAGDTGTGDTGTGDTGSGDTGSGDTGSDDTGPGCPRPVSTAPPLDVSKMGCDMIQAKYVPYVADAKTCVCDADCTKTAARDLCGCNTYVSPANDAYASLDPMAKRFAALSCVILCPKTPCIEPSTPKCIFDTSGSGLGKCN